MTDPRETAGKGSAIPAGWSAADELMLDRAAKHAIEFRRSLATRPQRPRKSLGDMRQAFAGPLPAQGRDGIDVIEDLVARADPGLAAMAGPRFFGWVIGASHPAGVAADWLTSAWGQNAAGHTPTPAVAACEEIAAGWLLELLDLPRECSVGFVTGATMANLTCLAAARGEVLRRAGWDADADGLFGAPPIQVILGEEAHASVFAALQLLGLGHHRVTRLPVDDQGRMELRAFEMAMARTEGPVIAIAQAGHVNSGAFDPIGEIAAIGHRRKAWLHVDGAFGLWARACPETASLVQGLEAANSWATDGHKWLQLPYDCGFAIIRDAEAHRRAMTITASYLPALSAGERIPADYVPELSRRARGFPVWAMIRALGRDGVAQMVARHCRIARRMAEALGAEAGIAVLNRVELNQIVVRFGGDGPSGDDLTRRVIERVQRDGTCFAAGAQWKGRWIMRLSVISWYTTEAEADRAVAAIVGAWRAIRAGEA